MSTETTTIKYELQIAHRRTDAHGARADDGLEFWPIRDSWEEAAKDAVDAGVAVWENQHVMLMTDKNAKIVPVRVKSLQIATKTVDKFEER